jgi:3-methyladenine DNA glycosylase/8-oxoguanine DNA glycosylase
MNLHMITEEESQSILSRLGKSDRTFARWMKRAGPFDLKFLPTRDPFKNLLRSICYQQLTGKAAATIYGRMIDLFPGRNPSAEILSKIPDSALRSAGLSGSKVLSIRDLARATLEGELPSEDGIPWKSDSELVEALSSVRGVGPWTVHMYLMFSLGRPDVLPVADYGIRKGYALMQRKKKLPEAAELEEWAEPLRPYRTVASWYLWRILDTLKTPQTK